MLQGFDLAGELLSVKHNLISMFRGSMSTSEFVSVLVDIGLEF